MGFVKYLVIKSNSESICHKKQYQAYSGKPIHNNAIDIASKQDNGKLVSLNEVDKLSPEIMPFRHYV